MPITQEKWDEAVYMVRLLYHSQIEEKEKAEKANNVIKLAIHKSGELITEGILDYIEQLEKEE